MCCYESKWAKRYFKTAKGSKNYVWLYKVTDSGGHTVVTGHKYKPGWNVLSKEELRRLSEWGYREGYPVGLHCWLRPSSRGGKCMRVKVFHKDVVRVGMSGPYDTRIRSVEVVVKKLFISKKDWEGC